MIHRSLSNVLFSFQLFACFLLLFLLLSSSFNACDQIECRGLFLFSCICWGLLCALRYDQFWIKFHGLLRRMYIVQMLYEIVSRYQLSSFDLLCDLVLEFLYWFFCLDDLSICDRGLLMSSTTTVLESICPFKSFKGCLMKFGALRLSAYRLIIGTPFWCICPFISMEYPSLSCLINVSLKSTLSEISIATPVCFQGPLAW
jgi:hypothetical protein